MHLDHSLHDDLQQCVENKCTVLKQKCLHNHTVHWQRNEGLKQDGNEDSKQVHV